MCMQKRGHQSRILIYKYQRCSNISCTSVYKLMFFCVLFEGLQTSFKMPLQFSLVYFLVVLLSVNFAHGIKPANVEIEQLKVLYQSMSAKLQNVEYENQRLNSEVTRLQTRKCLSISMGFYFCFRFVKKYRVYLNYFLSLKIL